MQSLRIALFLHASSLGGAERSHVELIKVLEAAGHETITFCPEPDMGLQKILLEDGVRMFSIKGLSWWTNTHADKEILSREVDDIKTLLSEIKPNIVITQSAVIVQPLIASFCLNIPHIQFMREFIDLDFGMYLPFNKECFGSIYRSMSDLVVCNSFAVRNYFYPEVDSKKVVVLRPFPKASGNRKHNPSSNIFTFGLVGALIPAKGHLKVVEAVESLSEEVRSKIHVKFFYHISDSEFQNQLQRKIFQSGLGEIFSFEGQRLSLDEIYSEFECLISASQFEAFGRTPIEAMAFGVPTIYSKTSGVAEYMRENIDGIGFDVNDSVGLSTAMTKIALDNSFFSSLREKVAKRYSELGSSPDYKKFPALLLNVINSRDKTDSIELSSLFFGFHAQYNSLIRERGDLILRLDDLIRERGDLILRLDDLIRERGDLILEHNALVNSTIWRLSQPIRVLISILRKFNPI